MNQNTKIRMATSADLPSLLEFEQRLIDFERPFDPSLKQEGKISYYDLGALIESADAAVFVAEHRDRIVGSGFGKVVKNPPKCAAPEHGYVGFIFVENDFRRMGISSEIMDTILSWFRSRGITEARLKVYSENAPAISAYRKLGFSEGLIEMRLELD